MWWWGADFPQTVDSEPVFDDPINLAWMHREGNTL